MFYIVETEEQLQRLEGLGYLGCFADIITTNDNFHPALTDVVALYIRPLEEFIDPATQKPEGYVHGYIIPINHNEGLCVSRDRAFRVLDHYSRIYTLDKKSMFYHYCGKTCNMVDLSILYSSVKYEQLELGVLNRTCNWYYNRYGGEANINQIIPLSKLFEFRETVFEKVQEIFSWEIKDNKAFIFYNEVFPKIYYLIESQGIRVDVHSFIKMFNPLNPDFSIRGETVYGKFNLHNVTSRPTNSFNSVNFLAIPKGQEFRRCFKPRPGCKFVEMDYDGYHVRLVAKEIDYKLNLEERAHKQLAKQYFGKSEISDEEYMKAKQTNFRSIYGAIPDEYKHLEFFEKLDKYIKSLWKTFKVEGKIQNRWGKEFSVDLKNMNPVKLMNYLIQSIETGRNVEILYKVLKYLKDKQSRIVLVTYDSFLIEWNEADGEEVLQEIKKIMEKGGFPVHVKVSSDLNF